MLSEETIKKLYNRVDNILANLAFKDYYNTNYKNGKKKSKKHIPYNLSFDTLEVLETLKLIHENMDRESEETVKGLIMKYRLKNPEYLESRP